MKDENQIIERIKFLTEDIKELEMKIDKELEGVKKWLNEHKHSPDYIQDWIIPSMSTVRNYRREQDEYITERKHLLWVLDITLTKFLEMIKYKDFCDDKEKMYDFLRMSKEDFLKSYSYLTEYEYDETWKKL